MTVDPRLQEWLDGEISEDQLPLELRGEAAEWSALLRELEELPVPGSAPGAEARIMAAVRRSDRESPAGAAAVRSWAAWLVLPRPIRLSPIVVAATLALVAWSLVRLVAPAGPAADGDPGRVFVQFVIAAPEARSVALAGDFNDWDPSIELSDPDLDGVWSARVALDPGVHEYMFVIDGSEWRPDPNSLSYSDDGFGQRNSVLAVSPLEGT